MFQFLLYCILLMGSYLFSTEQEGHIYPGKEYIFLNDPIDVVIPCIEEDLDTLELCIAGIRNNCTQIKTIFVVSQKRLSHNAEWIPESIYPFDKKDIALALFDGERSPLDYETAIEYIAYPKNRLGWLYQQLIKLYTPLIIPKISSNVLMLDADTVFLNPVTFTDEQGAACFNVGSEYHKPYFAHMRRLLPNLHKVYPAYSGVSHHMLFQKCVLLDLKSHIETYHQQPMWKALIQCIDHNELAFSSMSEYEIYFNFALQRSNQFTIRPLIWDKTPTLNRFEYFKQMGYHYVSAHRWYRE